MRETLWLIVGLVAGAGLATAFWLTILWPVIQ